MTLSLTPSIIEASYVFLRALPPFSGWRLPESDEIAFHVCATAYAGYHTRDLAGRKTQHIAISSRRVGHTHTLNEVTGHEMIHLKQAVDKTETPNTEHNAAFDRLAKLVCRIHGWDWKDFYR